MRSTMADVLSMSPKKRTSPLRPMSATAREIFYFDVSSPTKAPLFSVGGSMLAHPAQPSFVTYRRDEPPVWPRTYGLGMVVDLDNGVIIVATPARCLAAGLRTFLAPAFWPLAAAGHRRLRAVTAAGLPIRVGADFHASDRRARIVAMNHQLRGARDLIVRIVLDGHAEARTGPQRRGKGIIDDSIAS